MPPWQKTILCVLPYAIVGGFLLFSIIFWVLW